MYTYYLFIDHVESTLRSRNGAFIYWGGCSFTFLKSGWIDLRVSDWWLMLSPCSTFVMQKIDFDAFWFPENCVSLLDLCFFLIYAYNKLVLPYVSHQLFFFWLRVRQNLIHYHGCKIVFTHQWKYVCVFSSRENCFNETLHNLSAGNINVYAHDTGNPSTSSYILNASKTIAH